MMGGQQEKPANVELPYYKWYNEVWPTLYNKDPDAHLLKGAINIIKRDSLKSKKSNISNNSVKAALNRRISVKSGNMVHRMESGGSGQSFEKHG